MSRRRDYWEVNVNAPASPGNTRAEWCVSVWHHPKRSSCEGPITTEYFMDGGAAVDAGWVWAEATSAILYVAGDRIKEPWQTKIPS